MLRRIPLLVITGRVEVSDRPWRQCILRRTAREREARALKRNSEDEDWCSMKAEVLLNGWFVVLPLCG